ncbi:MULTISPECIES: phospholipase A [Myroides]|uniref:Phosphatidylcholine 1-acylhydrolase n=1 Tax=Myroides albus TaxID=2562892 RepID=A0A6I3LMP9_9FLAO|nr:MULTISPECIES: phospholipase A [Myroides]MTG97452.1 phospholipase [Myroides albus]MVX36131.1 phospholipase [Myroides sp. LoEW2-1]UVD79483.1 phospholipase A [Myroides albus]
MIKRILLISFALSSYSIYAQEADDLLFSQDRQNQGLDQRWELTPETRGRTFTISPYKPVYILPFRYVNKPNELPASLSEPNVSTEHKDYDNLEIKFQISFKTKVVQGLFFGKGDLWVAFTQTANWQAYNGDLSRPFRELNYEPELLFNYPLNLSWNRLKFKMIGFGFNHQSNGQSLPESRSWNRFTMHLGMEYDRWTFFVRPWLRLREKANADDNPQITEYVGKGEFNAVYANWGHVFTLNFRTNFRFNEHHKGYTEFTWSYPIKNHLKAFLAISNGYGDSMIDYNWNQTNIGIGISLMEWL